MRRISSGVGTRRRMPGWQRHFSDLQRPVPDELANPDSISPSSPRMIFPGVTRFVTHPSVAFDGVENRIETDAQILQYMVVVIRGAVVGPQRRGGAAHQNGVGNDLLEPCR